MVAFGQRVRQKDDVPIWSLLAVAVMEINVDDDDDLILLFHLSLYRALLVK